MGSRRVGISVGPSTQLAAELLVAELEKLDFVPELISEPEFEVAVSSLDWLGAVDLSLGILVAELLGGSQLEVAHRLTGGPTAGLPLVIVPGACDTVKCDNPSRSITKKEADRLAKDIAQKASASRGPTSIVVPLLSWSTSAQLESELAQIFVDCLRLWLSPAVRLHTIRVDLGSVVFAQRTAEELMCLISGEPGGQRTASC